MMDQEQKAAVARLERRAAHDPDMSDDALESLPRRPRWASFECEFFCCRKRQVPDRGLTSTDD